ncbi:MAG: aldolase [Candidatus Sericytochromatia bacterium]|nr:MAG: aldolase [Candidatus Sericytochromatia bacterium]
MLPDKIDEQEKLALKENKNHYERLAFDVYNKVENKLINEAVEDFRIDFEDGFGNRPDKEEDETAVFAAQQLAKALKEKTLPPFIGIRIKPFNEELKYRATRTLDLFLNTLLKESFGQIPENFVITLPKVTIPEQVTAFVNILEIIEKENNLEQGTFKIEIMIETTQAIFNQKGEANLLKLVKAAKGRCRGAHFGTYDYTASCDITAKYQIMDHDACNFARHMMKVCLAGTGVWLSDGATNVMPVGPHKGDLNEEQKKENIQVVHNAWKLAYDHIQHSLKNAFYQGWDLHPAQLCVRYGAVYTFFLESLEQASTRLKNFIEKAAQATLVGDVFDDAATGQGLLNYFLRALNCGAVSIDEITNLTGLTLEEIRTKSFLKILENRKLR